MAETYRCTKCGTDGLPVAAMVRTTWRTKAGERREAFYWCRQCKYRQIAEWNERQLDDPERAARFRERRAAASRRARERNPERARAQSRAYTREMRRDPKYRARVVQRRREREAANPELRERRLAKARARHAERMAADPEYARRRREHHRMARAVKAMREGRELRPRTPIYVYDDAVTGAVAAKPVGVAVERFVRRVALASGLSPNDVRERLAERCGVNERTLRAWSNEERSQATFAQADRALDACGLRWWDAFDPADPEAGCTRADAEHARALFEGELAEAA